MRWNDVIEERALPNYNLQAKYDEFNAKYFNNELPTIPLGWRLLKNVGGKVSYTVGHKGPKPNPRMVKLGYAKKYQNSFLVPDSMKLTMSTLKVRTEEGYDGVLLHEMIHVWFIHNGDLEESHGPAFKKKVEEISNLSGINVPMTDSEETEISVPAKPLGVMLVQRPDGSYIYALYSGSKIKLLVSELADAMGKRVASGKYKSVYIYLITDSLWTELSYQAAVQRKVGTVNYYLMVNPHAFAALKKKGQVLWHIEYDDVHPDDRIK